MKDSASGKLRFSGHRGSAGEGLKKPRHKAASA